MKRPILDKLHRNQLSEKFIKNKYPEYWKELDTKFPNLSWQDRFYLDQHNLETIPTCPICGNPRPLISLFRGYREYCSRECSYKDSQRVEKIENTISKRYGVKHALQNSTLLQKSKDTNIERYGVSNYSSTDECRKKVKSIMLERWGGVGSGSDIIKSKVRETYRKNRINSSQIDGFVGYSEDGLWIMNCRREIKCPNCDGKYTIYCGNYFDRLKINSAEICTKINPINDNRIKDTQLELFVKNILNKNNIRYISNSRNLISPKEVDIYIPEKKIAIEVNGLFWHSIKEDTYHIEKYKLCRDKGVQLLNIWQDWIYLKPEIVESIILSKLGCIDNKLYARKCRIDYVDSKTASDFLERNHIQGRCRNKVNIGLFYSNELVSIMCFSRRSRFSGSRRVDGEEWVLNRFCNKIFMSIPGAASRLLSFFIKEFSPKRIISFSCNDISDGNLYNILKFKTDDKINNSYWYVDNNTFKRYHRSLFSKTMLKKKNMYVEGLTEREIMRRYPYYRICDSGTIKWTLEL